MAPWIDHFNFLLSGATIILQGAVILAFTLFILRHSVLLKIARYALFAAFFVACGAVVGSLVYSNIIGYEPCDLCWYQRIFLYPLVLITGMALFKKDRRATEYGLVLAIPGAAVAGYHYYGQMVNTSVLPCTAATVSCAQRFFVEFDYMTMPLMSLTVFLFVIVCLLIYKREHVSS